MKSSCETRTEFLISKQLFLKYINTYCVTALGLPFTEPLLVWYRNSIETQESNFCFYLRNRIRHYDEYTNSIHEGTNNALKHRSGAVQPSLTLKKSVAKISFFADIDNHRRKNRVAYEYLTNSTDWISETASWLTESACKMIKANSQIKHKYAIY